MRPTYSLSTKRRNFSLSRKLDRWKLFSLQPSSAIKKTLFTLMREQRSQQWEKVVTTWVHLFGLTNKATWPKVLTSGAKINCQARLWILSLPVSGSTMWALCLSSPSASLWLSSLAVLDHANDNPGKGLLMNEVVRPLCILLDNQTLKNVTTWVHLFGLTTKPRASNR